MEGRLPACSRDPEQNDQRHKDLWPVEGFFLSFEGLGGDSVMSLMGTDDGLHGAGPGRSRERLEPLNGRTTMQVKTNVKAGGLSLNHNETLARARAR